MILILAFNYSVAEIKNLWNMVRENFPSWWVPPELGPFPLLPIAGPFWWFPSFTSAPRFLYPSVSLPIFPTKSLILGLFCSCRGGSEVCKYSLCLPAKKWGVRKVSYRGIRNGKRRTDGRDGRKGGRWYPLTTNTSSHLLFKATSALWSSCSFTDKEIGSEGSSNLFRVTWC